jgi:AraC family transcriptional regulator
VLKSPDQWAENLSAPPEIATRPDEWKSAILRQWSGTSSEMHQPPLNHHYVVQHLGGGKQVDRAHDGPSLSKVVDADSLTIVPAGTEFKWHTRGPIKFAHLYVPPELVTSTAYRIGKGGEASLVDGVGYRDPLLEAIFTSMLTEASKPGPVSRLYMDSMLETFVIRVLIGYSTANIRVPQGRETLPTFQLAKITEYIEANLASNLSLNDLASQVRSSIFHFSRAFRNTAGEPPHRYVVKRRVARAADLLTSTAMTIEEIAVHCGFKDSIQMSRVFSQWVGVTPSRYRRR